jgi:hypothetical protein
MMTQAEPHVGPLITKTVMATMVDDDVALQSEIGALCHYIQHTCVSCDVMKQQKH